MTPAPQCVSDIKPPVKNTTLDDFSPRQIIKHLYELGYRIEGGELVLIRREKVNIQSVLNEN